MLIRLAFAAVLFLAALAPAGAQTSLKASDLAREFEDIGFRLKYDANTPAERRFYRVGSPYGYMERPIRISVTTSVTEPGAGRKLGTILKGLTVALRERAGVDIQVKPKRQAFDVVGLRSGEFHRTARKLGGLDPSYVTAFNFAQGIKKEGCFFYSLIAGERLVIGGRVMVDIDQPPDRWADCIHRGVLYIMGLEGDTLAPTGVFTEVPKVRGLTARDLAIIRMAYDPRLKPGMTLAEARPLLPAIAADALAR